MAGTIGFTSTKFIPRDANNPKIVTPGKNYFVVKIHSAQADFSAPWWEKVNGLVVTSSVNLNHPVLGSDPIRALQFSRAVKKGNPEKLGSSKNLINFVPAIMQQVSISIEFILDIHNRMADLSNLINAGAFVTSISLGPGAATTAKTISEISQKLINTFIPDPNQQKPILQFTGDFTIPAQELQDGFYVILGTRDPKKPLPNQSAIMEVKDSDLYLDGKPATDWSYVILSVYSVDARTRDLNEDASWAKKLKEAEAKADLIECDPFASPEEKNEAWTKCRDLIKEASTLLLNDNNYLESEAKAIYRKSFVECNKKIFGEDTRLVKAARGPESKEIKQDREFLEIPLGEEINGALNRYEHQLAETKRIIKEEGLL